MAKSKTQPGKKRLLVICIIAVLLVAGAAGVYLYAHRADVAEAEAEAGPVHVGAAKAEWLRERIEETEPDVRWELLKDPEVRAAVKELRPEDMRGLAKVIMEQRSQEIKQFFEADAEEQKRLLDRDIDRMIELHNDEEVRKDLEEVAVRFVERFQQMTPETQQEMMRIMLSRIKPKQRAMFQEYRRQLMERAEERGIEFPQGPHFPRRR